MPSLSSPPRVGRIRASPRPLSVRYIRIVLCFIVLYFNYKVKPFKSGRLFASDIHAPACMSRQSPNAKGTPDSLSSVGVFIDKTTSFANALRLLCDVFLDFRSRSARGRSATFKRSSARQSTRRLPHRALCALRRITAYLHKAYSYAPLFLLRTANARHGRAHQSDASARIFCVLRRVFWSPQGHLVGDAAIGRACILCAPARSKERDASSQNLRTSAPFVALRGFPQVMGLMSSTELSVYVLIILIYPYYAPTYANSVECVYPR